MFSEAISSIWFCCRASSLVIAASRSGSTAARLSPKKAEVLVCVMAEVVTAGWFRLKRRKSGSAPHRWRRTELLHAGDVAVAGERRLQEGAPCLLADLHDDQQRNEGDDVRSVWPP